MVKSISLENHVAAAVQAVADTEERPFSQIVNRMLRDALNLGPKKSAQSAIQQPRKRKDGRAA